MHVVDFSPYHKNTTGLPNIVVIKANKRNQYYTAKKYFEKYYNAKFPNSFDYTYKEAKSFYHGNTKIMLECSWNSILGKYELQVTCKKVLKSHKFWKPDFIGTLTEFLERE